MKLREQIKYLRKSRGLTQRQLAKESGISYDLYTKFESGARNLSHTRLENVLERLSGSLCIVPYRFEAKEEVPKEYTNNMHGPNGVTMLESLDSIKLLFEELPNLLNKEDIISESIAAIDMFLTETISKNILGSFRKSCEESWEFYNERENGGKLDFEIQTTSLEMIAIDILKRGCDLKEFHTVPGIVEELLKE